MLLNVVAFIFTTQMDAEDDPRVDIDYDDDDLPLEVVLTTAVATQRQATRQPASVHADNESASLTGKNEASDGTEAPTPGMRGRRTRKQSISEDGDAKTPRAPAKRGRKASATPASTTRTTPSVSAVGIDTKPSLATPILSNVKASRLLDDITQRQTARELHLELDQCINDGGVLRIANEEKAPVMLPEHEEQLKQLVDDSDAMDFSEEYPGEPFLTGPTPQTKLCDIIAADENADEIEAQIFGGWIASHDENARLLFAIVTYCESERLISCASGVLVSWLETGKTSLVRCIFLNCAESISNMPDLCRASSFHHRKKPRGYLLLLAARSNTSTCSEYKGFGFIDFPGDVSSPTSRS